MKVLVVSAHFPPNFVSGGTLIPRGLATGLRRRGHDVHVFAGWRGDERSPLDQWDETDESGAQIRWINSTPWLSDLDDRQFDNPDITRAFAEYCDEVQPSVVNFHSLQALGAGPIEAASARGIPTVLTLHDFWWWCGRMFMSDRSDRPCCPVVDCGICDCSINAEWLARRNERLRESVRLVDRVVCVSSTLARVARANGVADHQLVTIENGLPSFPPSTEELDPPKGSGSRSDTIRFLYAGGPDPRKGPYVLAKALSELAGETGWSLIAYGWPKDAPVPAVAPVEARPPFPPDAVGAVLEGADVLVVPSIMRESYSILARQALSHGVPVITTDCLGPEEVVFDGQNGLVVPSADPVALGRSMRRLVTEPDLLKALRPHGHIPELRTMDECVDDYEKLLQELTDMGPAPKNGEQRRTQIKRVLFVVGITGAPLRYRAYLPAEALRDLGVQSEIRHYRHPDVDGLAAQADIVVFYRVPATIQIVNLISGLRARTTPTVFDVDDLIVDPEVRDEIPAVSILPPVEAEQWMEGVRRYRATLDLCDAFIGSTEPLASHAANLTGLPAFRFPNGVGRLVGRLSDEQYQRERSPGPLRIGYLSGTTTHDHDWEHVEPALIRIMDEHPSVELWLVGQIDATPAMDRHSGRIVKRPLIHWTELPAVLRDLDINLAPLSPDSRFNQAKSAIKWLEASLVGTATIASPTQPFSEVITHGRNGMLAESPDEWYSALDFLVREPAERRVFGDRSRRAALLDFAPALQGHRYLDILQSVRSQSVPASKTHTWRDVHDDEPSAPFELDAYDLRRHDSTPEAGGPVTMRRRIADTRITLRQEGLVAAARRTARYGASLVRRRLAAFRR